MERTGERAHLWPALPSAGPPVCPASLLWFGEQLPSAVHSARAVGVRLGTRGDRAQVHHRPVPEEQQQPPQRRVRRPAREPGALCAGGAHGSHHPQYGACGSCCEVMLRLGLGGSSTALVESRLAASWAASAGPGHMHHAFCCAVAVVNAHICTRPVRIFFVVLVQQRHPPSLATSRLLAQVTRAVVDAVGAERTAIRLAPFTTFLDAIDDDPVALGTYMTDQARRLARRAAQQAVGCCGSRLPGHASGRRRAGAFLRENAQTCGLHITSYVLVISCDCSCTRRLSARCPVWHEALRTHEFHWQANPDLKFTVPGMPAAEPAGARLPAHGGAARAQGHRGGGA